MSVVEQTLKDTDTVPMADISPVGQETVEVEEGLIRRGIFCVQHVGIAIFERLLQDIGRKGRGDGESSDFLQQHQRHDQKS